MDYEKVLNTKLKSVKPSGIRKFFDLVTEMPDAISLGVGEPDFVTPWEIRDAAIKSIQKGYTAYTSNQGLPELRKEIVLYLKNFGLDYDYKKEILVTIGASEAIDIAFRAILNEGDEVLIPEPSYVSYEPDVVLAGGTPRPIDCGADVSYKITKKALEAAITPRTKAVILTYPNNPTGSIMEKHELETIADVIKEHNLIVVSDEIYAELTYGKRHVSIASIDGMKERTILINGFSKAFAMTGWRVGYIACPEELLMPIVKIHQYVIMCAPTASQYAAHAALKSGRETGYAAVKEMCEKYDMRRRYLYREFTDMGLECPLPEGAFYMFPSVKKTGLDGEEFATRLLKAQKVALVPGNAFGASCAHSVRCSYATSMATLTEAVRRIKEFLGTL